MSILFFHVISTVFVTLSFGYALRQIANNKVKVAFVALSVSSAFAYMWLQVMHYANWYDRMLWENYGEGPEPIISWGNMSDTVLRLPIYVSGAFLFIALCVHIRQTRRKNRAISLLEKLKSENGSYSQRDKELITC